MVDFVDETAAGRPPYPQRLKLLAPSAICLLIALILPFFIYQREPPRVNGLGPGAWPLTMLALMAIFSALWLLQDLRTLLRGSNNTVLRPVKEEGFYSYPQALVGLVLVVLYGVALVWLGFALSTCLFIVIWCLYSGLRNMKVVLPVAIIGTVILLWTFMGLAMMPLPRGVGIFDQFSIALLQLLRIY